MAQVEGLFISEKYIKNNSEIDDNVDVKKLLPSVWYCQKEYIERSLGTLLYEDLIAKVIAGTIAGNDLILVEKYISPALLWATMNEVQVPLLYNYRNKSVGKNSSDNSTPVDYVEHRYLKDFYKPRMVAFSQRLEKYLLANSTLFPLYMDVNDIDEIPSSNTVAKTSVWLGGEGGRTCDENYYLGT